MKNIFVSKTKEKKGHSYITATVVSRNSTTSKCTLMFPGETVASTKEYRYNPSAAIYVGNRVLLTKESGSYYVYAKLYN